MTYLFVQSCAELFNLLQIENLIFIWSIYIQAG